MTDLLGLGILVDDVQTVPHQASLVFAIGHLPGKAQHLAGAGLGSDDLGIGNDGGIGAGGNDIEGVRGLDVFGVEIDEAHFACSCWVGVDWTLAAIAARSGIS